MIATRRVGKAQAAAKGLRLGLLKRGRVVLVGLGGIGQVLSRHLAMFLSALRGHRFRLSLVDGDHFEPENGYRVDIPDFGNKAEATAADLERRFGRRGLTIDWSPEYVTPRNARRLVRDGDFVLAGLDNHASRLLLSRRVAELRSGVLVSGGNDGVDNGLRGTYGNVQVYVRSRGRNATAPLDRFHPEVARPADKSPAEMDCLELAAGGAPQLGFANLAVAAAMLGATYRLLTGERMFDEVCLDLMEGVSTPHRLT